MTVSARSAFQSWFWLLYVLVLLGFREFLRFPSTFRLCSGSFLLGFSSNFPFPQYFPHLFGLFFTGVFEKIFVSPVLSTSVRALFYWGFRKFLRFPSTFRLYSVSFLLGKHEKSPKQEVSGQRRWIFKMKSAQSRNRTSDTRIFSPLLYQLSYLGEK